MQREREKERERERERESECVCGVSTIAIISKLRLLDPFCGELSTTYVYF